MGGGVWREAKELGGGFSPCFKQYFLLNSPFFFVTAIRLCVKRNLEKLFDN